MSAGAGSDTGSGVSTSGVVEDGDRGFYGDNDGGIEDDGVESAGGSLTSASGDSGNGSMAGSAGSGGCGTGGRGETGGGGIGAGSEGNTDALRSVSEEGEGFGRAVGVVGGGKSASLRRLSRYVCIPVL